MGKISKIKIQGTAHDIKDAALEARVNEIDEVTASALNDLASGQNIFKTKQDYLEAKNTLSYPSVSLIKESGEIMYDKNGQGNGYGHDFVDTGVVIGGRRLVIATMNIGAKNLWEPGTYFAWGDTVKRYQSKEQLESLEYQFTHDNYLFERYNETEGDYVITAYNDNDHLTELIPRDDAASALWGGEWRMPTDTQAEDLFPDFVRTISQTEIDGHTLYAMTFMNGNIVYLPITGVRFDEETDFPGASCFWTNTIGLNDVAYHSVISQGGAFLEGNARYYGMPIRPVMLID